MDNNSRTIKYAKYVSKLQTSTKFKVIINAMRHHVDQVNMDT